MYRLTDLSWLVWRRVPEWTAGPLGAVTALGGASFLLFALSLLYWLDDRRSTAALVSYAFVALAVVVAVKTALGLARPPGTVRLIPLENDPYGFPSGHAVAAVVVYGGLITLRNRLTDRRAVAAVAAVVAMVGFSRVALGMHYVGDVVAGTVLGVSLLALCSRVVADDPTRGFALAAVVSVPALLVTALGPEALLAFGGSVGGAVGSRAVDALSELRSRLHGAVLTAVGVPYVFGVDELAEGLTEPALVVLAYAVLVAGILALPVVVGRVPLDALEREAA